MFRRLKIVMAMLLLALASWLTNVGLSLLNARSNVSVGLGLSLLGAVFVILPWCLWKVAHFTRKDSFHA